MKGKTMVSDKESLGHYPCTRAKATEIMRARAKILQAQARDWLTLANALDEIERSATQGCEGDGRHPYIGIGSAAETFLWKLATRDTES